MQMILSKRLSKLQFLLIINYDRKFTRSKGDDNWIKIVVIVRSMMKSVARFWRTKMKYGHSRNDKYFYVRYQCNMNLVQGKSDRPIWLISLPAKFSFINNFFCTELETLTKNGPIHPLLGGTKFLPWVEISLPSWSGLNVIRVTSKYHGMLLITHMEWKIMISYSGLLVNS